MADHPVFHCQFVVTWTDRTRDADGRYNTFDSFVAVDDSAGDPSLLAIQIVAAIVGGHCDGMVLGHRLVNASV